VPLRYGKRILLKVIVTLTNEIPGEATLKVVVLAIVHPVPVVDKQEVFASIENYAGSVKAREVNAAKKLECIEKGAVRVMAILEAELRMI
jgi:hypothetical protein